MGDLSGLMLQEPQNLLQEMITGRLSEACLISVGALQGHRRFWLELVGAQGQLESGCPRSLDPDPSRSPRAGGTRSPEQLQAGLVSGRAQPSPGGAEHRPGLEGSPGIRPWIRPGSHSWIRPGSAPGSAPDPPLDPPLDPPRIRPWIRPGSRSWSRPRSAPGAAPDPPLDPPLEPPRIRPWIRPGAAPGAAPDPPPGAAPDPPLEPPRSRPWIRPGSRPGSCPGSTGR
ncbi:translation initiation factor IF-2-like [Perognathus longimembris pacificus]|uniref:translation initiation factor IF-2-like n=1 Tax=Perognathus longimembris pacificus TaxID=214514 RepID=UPI002019978C|nr:translation initiation factor IF-2-like [Perognathus longimembris pacificus]